MYDFGNASLTRIVEVPSEPETELHRKISASRVSKRVSETPPHSSSFHPEELTIANVLPDIFWTALPNGWYDYFNQKWFEYSGLTLAESQGQGLGVIIHAEDRERYLQAWKTSLAEQKPLEIKVRLKRYSDQTYRRHLVRAGLSRDPTGRVTKWFGTCVDIEDRERAEEDRILLVAALYETTQKLNQRDMELEKTIAERTSQLKEITSEMESFSYKASHDLRSPLRIIEAHAKLLMKNYSQKLDSQGRDSLEIIRNSATQMNRLIEDLLAYGKITHTELHLQTVDLNEIVRDVVREQLEIYGNDAHVVIENHIPPVRAYEPILYQVVTNLLTNAIKYVKPGTIPKVRFNAQRRGNFVRLWVIDQGIGIDSTNHKRIFQEFVRLHTDKEYEGTGIGLAIVRKAVERMGGKTGVESELDKGSKFWIELPKA